MREPLGHLLHQASRRSGLVHALAFPITCSRVGRNGNSCAVKKSPRAAPAGSARPSHGVGVGLGEASGKTRPCPRVLILVMITLCTALRAVLTDL